MARLLYATPLFVVWQLIWFQLFFEHQLKAVKQKGLFWLRQQSNCAGTCAGIVFLRTFFTLARSMLFLSRRQKCDCLYRNPTLRSTSLGLEWAVFSVSENHLRFSLGLTTKHPDSIVVVSKPYVCPQARFHKICIQSSSSGIWIILKSEDQPVLKNLALCLFLFSLGYEPRLSIGSVAAV